MEVMETPVTVVILAAGLGTRMKSHKAKVLHRAGGKTLVEHAVDTALALTSAERVFVVVGHQAERVRAIVSTPGIGFIEQTEQLGTGHALLAGREALSHLDGYLAIVYGDGPLLRAATVRSLIETLEASEAAGALLSADMPDPNGYGRVLRGVSNRVTAVVEQKAATPSNWRFAKPTWASTAIAPTCSGGTRAKCAPTIPRTNITSPTWSRYSTGPDIT